MKLKPLIAVVAVLVPLATGCASARQYAATPLPTTPAPAPAAAASPGPECENRLQSYNLQPLTRMAATDAAVVTRVRNRGRLVVGVSSDTLQFGARDPLTGQIVGFDIDLARAVAGALLGDPNRVELRVITAGERIPRLQEKDPAKAVDMVARNMSITCDRWTQIAFSAEYYPARQGVLVPRGSSITSVAKLDGKRVCAPAGSTSLDNLRAKVPGAVLVPAATHTACLILFQRAEVDAITGDDPVLAGLAKQDPYATVLKELFGEEPYGLGLPPGDPTFVGVVNTALANWISGGGWAKAYDTWLMPVLKINGAPPAPVYGRR